jgi:hypothetical protein
LNKKPPTTAPTNPTPRFSNKAAPVLGLPVTAATI